MMTVRTDGQRRIELADATPDELFTVSRPDNEHWIVSKLRPVTPRRSRSDVLKAIRTNPLKMRTTWNELRSQTREP